MRREAVSLFSLMPFACRLMSSCFVLHDSCLILLFRFGFFFILHPFLKEAILRSSCPGLPPR